MLFLPPSLSPIITFRQNFNTRNTNNKINPPKASEPRQISLKMQAYLLQSPKYTPHSHYTITVHDLMRHVA